MNKEFDEAVEAVWNRYEKYGIDRYMIASLMKSGMEEQGFSLRAAYNGVRMVLAEMFNEQEFYSVEDVMEITGESREEVVKRIEEMRDEVAANGEDPDKYARKIHAPTYSVHIYKDGLS